MLENGNNKMWRITENRNFVDDRIDRRLSVRSKYFLTDGIRYWRNMCLYSIKIEVIRNEIWYGWSTVPNLTERERERNCVRKKTGSPPPVNKILHVMPLALQFLNPPYLLPSLSKKERAWEMLLPSRRWKASFLCLLSYTFLGSVLRTEYQFTRGTSSTLLFLSAISFVVEHGHPLLPIF